MNEEQKEKWYNSFTREQLVERCEYLQRSCERKENTIADREMEIADLESIITEVREYIEHNKQYAELEDYEKNGEYYIDEIGLLEILDKENNNEDN